MTSLLSHENKSQLVRLYASGPCTSATLSCPSSPHSPPATLAFLLCFPCAGYTPASGFSLSSPCLQSSPSHLCFLTSVSAPMSPPNVVSPLLSPPRRQTPSLDQLLTLGVPYCELPEHQVFHVPVTAVSLMPRTVPGAQQVLNTHLLD